MTSKYIKCDHPGCKAVVDRRPAPDTTHGGTFHWSQSNELRQYAETLGWVTGVQSDHPHFDQGKDYCPDHPMPKP